MALTNAPSACKGDAAYGSRSALGGAPALARRAASAPCQACEALKAADRVVHDRGLGEALVAEPGSPAPLGRGGSRREGAHACEQKHTLRSAASLRPLAGQNAAKRGADLCSWAQPAARLGGRNRFNGEPGALGRDGVGRGKP